MTLYDRMLARDRKEVLCTVPPPRINRSMKSLTQAQIPPLLHKRCDINRLPPSTKRQNIMLFTR